jgi:prepilin-type N-terminal cleavage/methylation domain-containing protein
MQKLLTNHNESGFSLIELMIVVALIAITVALALPNMIGQRADAKLKGAVSNLKGDLNKARTLAIRENANAVILLEANHYQVFVDNGAGAFSNNWERDDGEIQLVRQLPSGVSIDIGTTDLSTACPNVAVAHCTLFNERGLPHPDYIGIIVVEGADGQGQIQMNRLGRLTVQ